MELQCEILAILSENAGSHGRRIVISGLLAGRDVAIAHWMGSAVVVMVIEDGGVVEDDIARDIGMRIKDGHFVTLEEGMGVQHGGHPGEADWEEAGGELHCCVDARRSWSRSIAILGQFEGEAQHTENQ